MNSKLKNFTKSGLLTLGGAISMGGAFILMRESVALTNLVFIPVLTVPCSMLAFGKYYFDKATDIDGEIIKKKSL